MKINYKIFFLTIIFTLITACSSVEEIEPNKLSKAPSTEEKALDKTPEKKKAHEEFQLIPQQEPEEILSSYHLGKGDLISIKVFGEDDFSVTAHVNKEGSISYPMLGELQLSGLTVNEVEKKIISGLQGDYLVNPKVTVTILEYRQIFVNGEVKNPGGYPFKPGMTTNKAISLGGGFTENASREEIVIIRDGDKSAAPTPANLDTYVSPGDIILVKEYKKFFINGEVKSPGSYGFIPELTVEKAISIAGGFGEYASPRWSKIYIIRDEDETSTSVRVELKTPVYPGDIITVEESVF